EKIGDTIHLLSTLYSPWFISDDSLGRLWFQGAASSSNLEIIQSDGSLSFQPFTVDNLSKEPFNRVSYSIYIDEEEQIWVGSTHGVHVMAQTNSWITYDPYSSQIPLYGNTSISGGIGLLSFIKNDSKNNIWIGRNEGLAVYKDGVWNSIELNGLFRNDGTFIIFDQQDNGWYLSEVDGSGNMVSQIIRVGIEETKSWDLTSSPASIPDIKTLGVLNDSTLILASTIDGQGGYVGSGIVKATFLANDSIEFDTTLLYLDATNDTPLIDIEVVNPSSLWYSNRNGLFIFNPLDSTIETVYSFVQNLIGDSTLQITYDPTNQIIWAHNYYCVFKFDSTGLLAKFDLPHQGNDYVTTLALDPDGIPWIMFPGDPINLSGALFFQLVKVLPDSSFLITTHEDLKIPEEGIEPNGFAIDDEGLIWIGLNTGVINFDPKAGPSFSIKNFSLCVGDTGRFNNYSPPADSFHWQVDGGFVTSDSNLTYTFLDPGTHEVSLIAFNDSLAESFSQFIFVKPSPVVEFPKDDTVACSERVYMNIGRNDLSYAWFDLQENLLASSPGFIIDSSGIYILEGTDGCGQFDRDTISVTLTTIPDSSCVWPGDVDANGWVNIYDFLILGTLIGDTGLSRPNAINDFISQPSPDWSETIIHGLVRPGINKKHADCNGDGVINEADMAIVFANAQGAFPQQVTAASSTLELRVVPREKTIQVGDTIHYDVYLYDLENGIVQNAYGLAFTIENNLLVSSPPILDKMNSWLGIPGDLEHGYIKYGLSTDIGLTLKTKMPKSDSANVHQFCSLLKAEDIDTSKWVNQIYFTTQTNNSVMVEVDGTEQSISALNAATLETVTVNIPWVDLEINVLLQGAMDEGLKMRTSLRDSNWLPKRHPYGTIYQAKPDSIPLEIVDWVLVELRDAQDPTQIISQRAAWVDSTGLIVDPEGGNGLGI
ncbi:MAG: dockerin type I domain-containing protein, partial [Bacteroidota bacterium]